MFIEKFAETRNPMGDVYGNSGPVARAETMGDVTQNCSYKWVIGFVGTLI